MCLLKTGACLIHKHFNVLPFSGNEYMLDKIHVACSIEVVTKTGFTVSCELHELILNRR